MYGLKFQCVITKHNKYHSPVHETANENKPVLRHRLQIVTVTSRNTIFYNEMKQFIVYQTSHHAAGL